MAPHSRHIYIHALPSETSYPTLRAICIPYGEITELHIPQKPNSQTHKGYAFVSYEEPEDAEQAKLNLDGAEFFGRTIRVAWASGRRGGGKAMTDEDVQRENADGEMEQNE